jgi:hypothetical protein
MPRICRSPAILPADHRFAVHGGIGEVRGAANDNGRRVPHARPCQRRLDGSPSRYPWEGRLFGIRQSINNFGPFRPRLGQKPPSRFGIRAARRRLRGVLALRGSFCALGRTHHCRNPTRSHRAAVLYSYTLGDQVDLWALCSRCRSYARCAQHAHAFRSVASPTFDGVANEIVWPGAINGTVRNRGC